MTLRVRLQSPQDWSHLEEPLVRAAESALTHEEVQTGSLTLVLTDGDAIQEFNRKFAGEDHPTDVLSFPDGSQDPHDQTLYLGDVLVALDVARLQAEAAGHTLIDELTMLTVHGVLHLLGYDHADPESEQEMWAAQNEILNHLNVRNAEPGEQA